MRIDYYRDTDSLFIKFKSGTEAEGAEGAEGAPGIVFHCTPEDEVTAIDIHTGASRLVDVSRLEVEGLPVGVGGSKWARMATLPEKNREMREAYCSMREA